MDKEKVEKLLSLLFSLTYTGELLGKTHDFPVISKNQHELVRNTVERFAIDNYNAEFAQLQAKCFVYEEMIKKSTFAPMLSGAIDAVSDDFCSYGERKENNNV